MRYTDSDDAPEDFGRRGFILALGALPVVGGGFELVARLASRASTREGAKAGARVLLEAEPERFPYSKAGEAAADRYQRDDRSR